MRTDHELMTKTERLKNLREMLEMFRLRDYAGESIVWTFLDEVDWLLGFVDELQRDFISTFSEYIEYDLAGLTVKEMLEKKDRQIRELMNRIADIELTTDDTFGKWDISYDELGRVKEIRGPDGIVTYTYISDSEHLVESVERRRRSVWDD